MLVAINTPSSFVEGSVYSSPSTSSFVLGYYSIKKPP